MEPFFEFMRMLLAPFIGNAGDFRDKKHRPRKRMLFGFCVLASVVMCYLLWLDARGTVATPVTFIVVYISTISTYIGHNIYIKSRCTNEEDDDLPGDLVVTGVLGFGIWLGLAYGLSQTGGILPEWLEVQRVPESLEWVYGPTIALFGGSTIFYRLLPRNGNGNDKGHSTKHDQNNND